MSSRFIEVRFEEKFTIAEVNKNLPELGGGKPLAL